MGLWWAVGRFAALQSRHESLGVPTADAPHSPVAHRRCSLGCVRRAEFCGISICGGSSRGGVGTMSPKFEEGVAQTLELARPHRTRISTRKPALFEATQPCHLQRNRGKAGSHRRRTRTCRRSVGSAIGSRPHLGPPVHVFYFPVLPTSARAGSAGSVRRIRRTTLVALAKRAIDRTTQRSFFAVSL